MTAMDPSAAPTLPWAAMDPLVARSLSLWEAQGPAVGPIPGMPQRLLVPGLIPVPGLGLDGDQIFCHEHPNKNKVEGSSMVSPRCGPSARVDTPSGDILVVAGGCCLPVGFVLVSLRTRPCAPAWAPHCVWEPRACV